MKSIRTRLFALLAVFFAAAHTVLADYQSLSPAPSGNWTDNDNKATAFKSGSGTQADPWVIETAGQLAFFAYQVTNNQSINGIACKTAYYSLQQDIDLKDHIWVPIGNLSTGHGNNFQGNFEGNGHVIKNMTVAWEAKSGGKKAYALFSSLLARATVRNLVIDNAYLYNTDTDTPIAGEDRLVAVFAGIIKSPTTIENIIIRNSKVEAAKAFKQNGKWIIYGGFAAKVADNNDNYILSNIYVDADIDFTKMTVNKSDAVYSALFIPEFFGNVKKAPQNIYLCGSIKSAANISKVGPVFGTNLPSSSIYSSTWQLNKANTFQYTTDSGTTAALTTKNAGGTAVSAFDYSAFNTYASENDLLAWTVEATAPALKKIVFPVFTKTRDESVPNNRNFECKVTMEDEEPGGYSYEWTLDDVKVESATTNTLTVTSTNKVINGKVKITNGSGYDYTCNFTIDPIYYSIDLYANEFGGGDGTASSPYIINDDMQLAKLARDVNNGNKYSGTYFKLGEDIKLDKALWMPIGYSEDASKRFGGKFDGAGHSISGMHLIWESLSGKWLNWGLFGSIMGTSDNIANYATVSNLIVKDAVLEKKAGNLTGNGSNEGTNVAVVSGELYPYAELSNIIVKGCRITDNGEAYTNNQGQLRIGGIVGNVENQAKNNAFRIFNISADTDINLFTNATTSKAIYMSSGIGKTNFGKDNTHLFPTNLYVHGSGVTTKTATNLNCGTLFGYMEGLTPTVDMQATWYYNAAGENVTSTLGNKLAFTDDNPKVFQNKANTYITDNSLSDKLLWSYDNVNHYTFGSIDLTGVENKNYTITAPEGTYTWYLSSDRTNWKAIEDKTTNVVEIPYQEYMQYVYATDGNSISKVITVPALRITNISLSHTEGSTDYSVSVSNSLWKNNDNLIVTYQWYENYESSKGENNTKLGTDASLTYNGTGMVSCHVTVTYNGKTIADEWVGGKRVIYLCPAGVTASNGTEYTAGKDENDGLTPAKPKLTWQGAYAALSEKGSWDENVIVLMGTSSSEATFNTAGDYKGFGILGNLTDNGLSGDYATWKSKVEASKLNRNTTITGKYTGNDGIVDYKGIIEMKGGASGQSNGENGGLGIFGDTRFENITFQHKGGQYDILYCQYNSLEMGEGVVMQGYGNSPGYGTLDGAKTISFQVFGGINNDNRFSPLDTETLIKEMENAMPHGKEGFTMTFKSGHYSTICAGGRQNQGDLNGVMGTANMPVKCTITMDIDRTWNDEHNNLNAHYDAGIIMAGNHEGAMFGDVDIIIKRGKIGRLVNGTLGAYRETNNKINAPFNTYMGRASITLDPRKDENGSPIHSDIVVTELYGGSCGRGFTGKQVIENPFYGHAKVTINGGTFKYLGSNDGGKLQKGIFGAGAGGMNGIGDGQTPDKRIGYWDGNVMKFGTYETAKSNLLTYNCYNADTHTYTVISPLDTKTEMIINGGEFGTSDAYIDGVYAGGSGYMAPGLWTEAPEAIPSPHGGNIYGTKGQTVVSLMINGGTFYCNEGVFAGGRGTDYYYKGNKYGASDASAYDKLGQIYGNVEMNINGGEFHCPVFGGGYGVADAQLKVTTTDESGNSTTTTTFNTLSDMALITGKAVVNIKGGTFYNNVYGGGDMARIFNEGDDATVLNISDKADIRGSVFAGGNGKEKNTGDAYDAKKTKSPQLVGKVTGNTNVRFNGSPLLAPSIYGDIYGGGNLAVVEGNANVSLFACNFAGEIFGGGKGLLSGADVLNSADVSGNTSILLAQDLGGQEEGEGGKLEDQFSINVIWDKLWNGTAFVTWNEENKTQFYADGKFINPHNIYGGGKFACVVGTYNESGELKEVTGKAAVNVQKGMTPFSLLQTEEWKKSYTDNKNPHFYVFGGGYGKNTKVGSTDVTVNVDGEYGIYNAEVDDPDDQLTKPTPWNSAATNSTAYALPARSSSEKGQVFDNSKGIPNFTILGVLGGGYAGTIHKDTKVTVDGKTFLHRVYGGGFGDPTETTADNMTGQVGGNTEVNVLGANIYGDVFGGGAGVASKTVSLANVARVKGTAKVEVSDDARIYGNVYGGGDIANVGEETETPNYAAMPVSKTTLEQATGEFVSHSASNYRTYVSILGGDIFGEVYGGGKGVKKADAPDYTALGKVNGNTLVYVANTEAGNSYREYDEENNNIPHIWSRLYGGCAYGTVDGNTLVHIEGGMFGNNIFGGGYGYLPTSGTATEYEMFNQVLGKKDTSKGATYANVLGNTKVKIDGGSWIWNCDADIDGNIIVWDGANDKTVADENSFKQLVAELKTAMQNGKENVKTVLANRNITVNPDFFDLNNLVFKKNHNIFGGGNQACLVGKYVGTGAYPSDPAVAPAEGTGKAEVEINHSPLTVVTNSYEGKVQTYDMLDNTTVAGLCWYLSINEIEYPQFSVFGAGFGANTKVGNTIVKAQPGATFDENGEMVASDDITYRYRSQATDVATFRDFDNALYADFTDPKKVSSEEKILYYGSVDGTGNDPKTYLRYRSSRMAWTLGLSGFTFKDIHGGGYSGYVCNTSSVTADNQIACRNIFGGGLGAKPYTATYGEESAAYDFGSVNSTSVDIKSGIISQDVFGGGAGISSEKSGDTYIDFSDMARVKTQTAVTVNGDKYQVNGKDIDRTIIFGSVYGGGDAANVGTTATEAKKIALDDGTTFATKVNINGGAIFSYIFAGGRGRLKSECNDYTKLGGIYGNTQIQVPSETTANILNRIYGGCQNGVVYGNTLVDIKAGNLGYNIFGGGWGDVSADEAVAADKRITSADVTGNTNIFVSGGNALLTSYWDPNARNWVPTSVKGNKIYSPQYDPEARKFKVNHNIYGGGNLACNVTNTYINMSKGIVTDGTKVVGNDNTPFFETNEWKEIYNKVGSPHFAVFGGGYGENTCVTGDTHVSINMETGIAKMGNIVKGEEYKHFASGFAAMDIVGGGYSGKVDGTANVNVNGITCRRIFGGGFYNSVNMTNVTIKKCDSRDIFGGGLMGDVLTTANVTVGQKTAENTNSDIYVHGSVYGGNDVSGYVNIGLNENGEFQDNGGSGTNINIYGGQIDGNVYGAGNGDYLYALDRVGNEKVTVNEHYLLNPDDPSSEQFDLVYTVPMRETMPSYKSASDAAKIVNINSWRPLTNKVNINIEGNGTTDLVNIDGDVYGGGNSATVLKVNPASATGTEMEGSVSLNIGNNVKIGRVFMGCNGDALFTASEDNAFMTNFRKLNGNEEGDLDLGKSIDWLTDPSNKGISTLYLPTKNDERPLVYPHLLDLYFQPVEMDIQGSLTWNGSVEGNETGKELKNCTIGTFCCGGNRGNMNVYPNTGETEAGKKGNVFEYTFPEGLTITDKIVGGCNNANYIWKSGEGKIYHEGGYLLGLAKSVYPFIKLNVKCQFKPSEVDGAYVGGNVYGGCYETGTIRGDITINLQSDMLAGKDKAMLDISNEKLATDPQFSALNVYGAGYGMESYVYGNPNVRVAEGVKTPEAATLMADANTFGTSATSANFIYGGGQQGNVIGVTNVEVFNGHIYKSVTGGSYSGFVWGSTHVKVGYPEHYTVNYLRSGRYVLNRIDQNNKDIDNGVQTASETIKQKVFLVTGDLVSKAVYNDIIGIQNGETMIPLKDENGTLKDESGTAYITLVAADTPSDHGFASWDDIDIVIGEAVYGGGYSLAHGASVMANNTTVLKFTDKYNLDAAFTTNDAHKAELASLPGGTTKGFGGNTTILIADRVPAVVAEAEAQAEAAVRDRDHITISRQDMKEANIADGKDLLGYYYKGKDEKYHYIYLAGKYFKGSETMPDDMNEIERRIFEYDNEGGIFGDGHLSYAEGFRSADLTGYGYADHTVKNPKIINTFQRMDILRLTDNCFSLLGARDYATNATDKTPYSISRVNEIQMVSSIDDSKKLVPIAVGTVTPEEDAKRARNYMGFANNILYVGALNSNVTFADKWHDGVGKLGKESDMNTEEGIFTDKSYQEVKQHYIDYYFKTQNTDRESYFQARNNGTAKNMIGIASGYALKIQGVQELKDAVGNITEKPYYGPIYGVIEMNLIDVREDEGGGYVYADNIHRRPEAAALAEAEGEAETQHEVDFLETTGNFVFPYMPQESRFIVDDCFPKGYITVKSGLPDDAIEAHYWYVTGFNYHFNAHITGYTYDTSKAAKEFFSNNQDGIMSLSGLKQGQEITIDEWRINSAHTPETYSCDLEVRNYQDGEKDNSGNPLKTDTSNAYNLFVGASDSNTYDDAKGFRAALPLNGNTAVASGDAKLDVADAKINFMLTDKADNTTSEYYNQHLSEPCSATLVLRAPALQYKVVDGNVDYNQTEAVTSYIALKTVYTLGADGKTYSPMTSGKLQTATDYYVKYGETNFYQKIDKSKIYVYEEGGNPEYTKADNVTLGAETTYYALLDRWYTYTIDLTIEYVEGPNINGNITIENCALPGEMIRLKKDKVTIKADESFAANGYYWRIGKDFDEGDEWKVDGSATNYSIYKVGDETGTGLFTGCYYNTTEDYIDVPAYYFMNGYKVQLGISMNRLEGIFSAKMLDSDKLVVHNYHHMDPHAADVDLHLAEAVERAGSEKSFAAPRIYLSDQKDLTAFTKFVNTDKDNGANAQFVFQNNIIAPDDYVAPDCFKGIIHGNGNVLSGLAPGKCFIKDNQGQIYNLGLASGKISSTNTSDGKYHCCFEYRQDENSSPVVYRLDGTTDKSYTDDDFRYGKVAYDLNQYYLEARHTLAGNSNLQYVKDYYANGDYQYAYRKDELTGKVTGIKYLRTGSGTAIYPNYGNYETRHDKTHAIDQPRAKGYVAATEEAAESKTGDYEPLFNAAKHDDQTAVANTEVMNDYLFWGQELQLTPDDYPSRIQSNQVSDMINRVYRAAGYYRDTKLSTFHHNALKRDSKTMGSYVYIPTTTAIDFTCKDDHDKKIGLVDGIYYAPVKDLATSYSKLFVKPEVSNNLLVYTPADEEANIADVYDAVMPFSYNEATPETEIELHHIVTNDNATYYTKYLHLVERADVADANNDFCAPIPFTVTDRAWYTRKPRYYAESANDAWEGICLPFTVDKAEASVNGEITHFYGTAPDGTPPADNHWNLHHEYWLRGMTAVSEAADKTTATFKRPGTDLFTGGGTTGVNYTFYNPFFVETYGSYSYNSDVNDYYTKEHTWTDYLPLTASTPYIISLPGESFYEFDLTSSFYNRTNATQPAQTVTFNAYGDKGTITIPVTADMLTDVSTYEHTGTYIATDPATGGIYGMNDDGTGFSDKSATILPFRTYMKKTASEAKQLSPYVSVIYIDQTTGIDNITPEGDGQYADETAEGDYVRVSPAGKHRILVESTFATTLKVFTASGKLYRLLDVRPGTATYSGFQPGFYIAGKAKLRVM